MKASTITVHESCTVAEGHHAVTLFHLLALQGALRLEKIGLKRRGRSALSIAKETTKSGSNNRDTQIALIDTLVAQCRARIEYIQEPTA